MKVDYSAIISNANYFKQVIGNNVLLCAVVKNDAYGHDIEKTCASLCSFVDYFAVGSISEANVVRKYGKPIIILLPQHGKDVETALKCGYELTVDSVSTLKEIQSCVDKVGKKAVVHVKIDTGMHRLGADCDSVKDFCDLFDDKVTVKGAFSHFCRADSDKEYTRLQYERFCNSCTVIERAVGHKVIKHIANTEGTLASSTYHLDMVRVGLGLYGYGCDCLLPAKTVSAKVIAVKNVKKGESISYGETLLRKDSHVAVINVGYANGLPRVLSNKIRFVIREKSCEQIGNICMGMCMVLSDDAEVGDEVTILGKGCNVSTNDVIIYELLCSLK